MLNRLIILIIVCFVNQSYGGVLLEPYLKYDFGSWQSDGPQGDTAKFDRSSLGFGGRLGYIAGPYLFAFDFSVVPQGKMKPITAYAGPYDTLFNERQFFALLGRSFSHFRLWIGYGFTNEITFQSYAGDLTYKSGTAYKFGVGTTEYKFFALNLEYILSTYKRVQTSAGEADLESIRFTNTKGSQVVLSISFPIEI